MTYKQLSIYTNTFGSELVANLLYECGSEGVSIYDSKDFADLIKSDVIWDYVDDSLLVKNEVVRVCGYFAKDNNAAIEQFKTELSKLKDNATADVGSLEIAVSEVEDLDWLNVWKQYYSPIEVGAYAIIPEWIKSDGNGKIKVLINPSSAFGTGEHESTKMCLMQMSDLDFSGTTVIDAGCGSGILGIAAAKSNAKRVVAYDIDESAVRSAQENSLLNDVVMEIYNTSTQQLPEIKADIFIANITADVLMMLAPQISKSLAKGGKVILSGIINSRLSEVEACYEKNGYHLEKRLNMGEWQSLRYSYGN